MIDTYFYITASIGVILFGISKGGFAGPASILAIPIMALSMNPVTAAAILLPILLIMDFIAMYFYWNKWDFKNRRKQIDNIEKVHCLKMDLKLRDKVSQLSSYVFTGIDYYLGK